MGSSDIHSPIVYSYGSSTVVKLSQEASSDKRVQVGDDYQVDVPTLLGEHTLAEYLEIADPCEPIWSPFAHQLTTNEVEDYIKSTVDPNGINEEQALAMLTYHNFDLSLARNELKKYRPMETHWSENDRISFENAFKNQGKNFSKIQQAVPHKSVDEVVFFYYSWKKPKIKTTVMDRYVEQYHDERPRIYCGLESEDDEALAVFRKRWKLETLNTKQAASDYHMAKKPRLDAKQLIVLEDNDQESTDSKSEAFGSSSCSSGDRSSSVSTYTHLPSYMRLESNQLISLAINSSNWEEDKLHMKNAIRSLEYEVQSLKRRNNETISKLDCNVKDFSKLVSSFRSPQQSSWTKEEETACVQALYEYGVGNLEAVSFVLGGSKSVAQIQNFLPLARIKYRLTDLLSSQRPTTSHHEVSPLRNASGINSACGTSTVTRAQLPLAPTANINGIIQNGLHGHSSDNNRTAQTGSASSARVAANSVVDDDDDDIVEIFPHSTLQKSFNETRNVVSGVMTSN